jgi:hypothetical protein
LEALKNLEAGTIEEEKGRTNTVLSSVDEILESLVRRGDKSARSPSNTLLALLSLPHIGTSNEP